MRSRTRYTLAVVGGVMAGAVAYGLSLPVVEATVAWFVTGLNLVIWTIAVGVYLTGYDRLDGVPVGDRTDRNGAVVYGGLGGLVGSAGFCGPILLTVPAFPFRYAAAAGLFGFGLVMAGMAAGIAATSMRLDHVRGDDTDATVTTDD